MNRFWSSRAIVRIAKVCTRVRRVRTVIAEAAISCQSAVNSAEVSSGKHSFHVAEKVSRQVHAESSELQIYGACLVMWTKSLHVNGMNLENKGADEGREERRYSPGDPRRVCRFQRYTDQPVNHTSLAIGPNFLQLRGPKVESPDLVPVLGGKGM